jgi:hypothetical protein
MRFSRATSATAAAAVLFVLQALASTTSATLGMGLHKDVHKDVIAAKDGAPKEGAPKDESKGPKGLMPMMPMMPLPGETPPGERWLDRMLPPTRHLASMYVICFCQPLIHTAVPQLNPHRSKPRPRLQVILGRGFST